jgi:hypothetical protein
MTFFGELDFFFYLAAGLLPAIVLGLCGRPLRLYAGCFSLLLVSLSLGR